MSPSIASPEPSGTAPTRQPADPDNRTMASGIAGLGFVILVVTSNLLRGQLLPHNSEAAQIVEYYVENGTKLTITYGFSMIALPLLMTYTSGMYQRLRSTPNGELWARVGWGAASALVVSFGLVVVTDLVTLSLSSSLPAGSEVILAVFKLRGAAFVVNSVILGMVLFGFATAARRSPMVPRWLSGLGFVGGLLLLLGAIPIGPVLDGSPWGFIGLAGFLCWLLWVVVTSIRMLRRES